VSLSGLALLAVPLDPGLLTRCTTPSSTGYERQAGRRSRCRALPASARYDGLTADCARLPGAFAGPEGLPAIGRSTPLANSARTVARSVRSDVSDPPETAKAGLSMRRLDAINSRVRLIMTSLVRTRSWDRLKAALGTGLFSIMRPIRLLVDEGTSQMPSDPGVRTPTNRTHGTPREYPRGANCTPRRAIPYDAGHDCHFFKQII
jgi:hypothetical protein